MRLYVREPGDDELPAGWATAHTSSLSALQSQYTNNHHYAGFCSNSLSLWSVLYPPDWLSLLCSSFITALSGSPLGHPGSNALELLAMRSSHWVFPVSSFVSFGSHGSHLGQGQRPHHWSSWPASSTSLLDHPCAVSCPFKQSSAQPHRGSFYAISPPQKPSFDALRYFKETIIKWSTSFLPYYVGPSLIWSQPIHLPVLCHRIS